MISIEYSLKCTLGMFSIIKNVSYECLYVMNLYNCTYQFCYKINIDHFDVHMLNNPRTIYRIIDINLIYTYAKQSKNNEL